jgi:hypothetical protein
MNALFLHGGSTRPPLTRTERILSADHPVSPVSGGAFVRASVFRLKGFPSKFRFDGGLEAGLSSEEMGHFALWS